MITENYFRKQLLKRIVDDLCRKKIKVLEYFKKLNKFILKLESNFFLFGKIDL